MRQHFTLDLRRWFLSTSSPDKFNRSVSAASNCFLRDIFKK